MKGTTGTDYLVVGDFDNGQIGIRELGNGSFRVRVMPHTNLKLDLSSSDDWTQPTATNYRYSTVTHSFDDLMCALNEAQAALLDATEKDQDEVDEYPDYDASPVEKSSSKDAVLKAVYALAEAVKNL